MTSRILVSLRVNTIPQRAFDAFVNDIGIWWRPNPIFGFTRRPPGTLAFEPQLGGRLTERFADGAIFEIGRITAWKPGELLEFTWRQESFADEQNTRVVVCFEPVDDQTRITVEHHGWDQIPQEHAARHRFPDDIFLLRHGQWWQTLLDSFRQRTEGPKLTAD